MTIIAFDVSKDELVGVRTNKNAHLQESIVLKNDSDVIDVFLQGARETYPHLTVACESTADYHRILAQQALALAIPFRLVNPIRCWGEDSD